MFRSGSARWCVPGRSDPKNIQFRSERAPISSSSATVWPIATLSSMLTLALLPFWGSDAKVSNNIQTFVFDVVINYFACNSHIYRPRHIRAVVGAPAVLVLGTLHCQLDILLALPDLNSAALLQLLHNSVVLLLLLGFLAFHAGRRN